MPEDKALFAASLVLATEPMLIMLRFAETLVNCHKQSIFLSLKKFFVASIVGGESLFLRKLVLGIPAQASGKNLTRLLMPSARRFVLVTSPRPTPKQGVGT
jgi:hypothetical protein